MSTTALTVLVLLLSACAAPTEGVEAQTPADAAPDALRVLQHIIVSHHAQPEYGAAKLPSTPEAIFVAMLDNLDAKTQTALTAAQRDVPPEGEPAAGFSDRVWALDTRIFRPDPLAGPPAG